MAESYTIGGNTTTLKTPKFKDVPSSSTMKRTDANGSTYSQSASQTSKTSVSVAHVATDDGLGAIFGTLGLVNYAGKSVALKVIGDFAESSYQSNYESARDFESLNETAESGNGYPSGPPPQSASSGGGGSSTARGGEYGTETATEAFASAALLVSYKTAPVTPQSFSETFTPPAVVIDLAPYTKDRIVPNSVRFTWMGTVYEDFEGVIYRGRTENDPGIDSGELDYETGIAVMDDYVVNGSPSSFTLNSLWTSKQDWRTSNVVFTTPVAPIKPTGLVLSVVDVAGDQIIATADLNGGVSGPHTRGVVDYETGQVEVQFGDYVLDSGLTADQKAEWWYSADDVRTDGKIWRPWPVDPQTLRYNVVAYFYLPLDSTILGLDPVRLPQDGRVPIFRPGGFAVLGNTGTVGPATVANSQVVNCARTRLSRVRVIGNNGQVITSGYTADLEAGTVTFTDVSGYSQPVRVEHRIEDLLQVAEVQINGTLKFTRQITHEYAVNGSYVSSALIAGDLRARVSLVMDQVTWTNVWSDVQIGSAATGTFNDLANPIVVTNDGALTERWAVIFTNTTAFQVVGEHVGVIAIGNTSADCAPLNPATGAPYFSIPYQGWGLGWATGNVLRFNTVGAFFPVWLARTVQQGPETVVDDTFTVLVRGDVDNPL